MDSPFSETVYTDKYIQSQQARTLTDVLAGDPTRSSGLAQRQRLRRSRHDPRHPGAGSNYGLGGIYGIVPGQVDTTGVERVEGLPWSDGLPERRPAQRRRRHGQSRTEARDGHADHPVIRALSFRWAGRRHGRCRAPLRSGQCARRPGQCDLHQRRDIGEQPDRRAPRARLWASISAATIPGSTPTSVARCATSAASRAASSWRPACRFRRRPTPTTTPTQPWERVCRQTISTAPCASSTTSRPRPHRLHQGRRAGAANDVDVVPQPEHRRTTAATPTTLEGRTVSLDAPRCCRREVGARATFRTGPVKHEAALVGDYLEDDELLAEQSAGDPVELEHLQSDFPRQLPC